MGKNTVGSMIQSQIKASGFDTKEMKISGKNAHICALKKKFHPVTFRKKTCLMPC